MYADLKTGVGVLRDFFQNDVDQTTQKLNLQNLIENYKNHIPTSFLILRNVSRIKKTRMVVI